MEAIPVAVTRKIRGSAAEVSEIGVEEALTFVADHHRQGVAQLGKRPLAYGLHFQGELLGVALFCNPRTAGMQKRYTTELFRMAFKDGVRVYGGASKLIRSFLEGRNPVDLFTYQDTAGEATAVYEHAGMSLVGPRNPRKKVLVRDGLQFAEASNNRSDWFSMEQAVRRGPDALIGTKLGEQFRENGKRLSNVELFLERCGYHLEEVPGDRVYEWLNPGVSFYVYRLSSPIDSGYYIGRKSIWKIDANEEDCLLDGYLGSGGKKFQNWVAKVGEETLRKEVLSIERNWQSVLRAEAKMLGELHRTDSNCKNTLAGGLGAAAHFPYPRLENCPIHGESKHIGNSCIRCSTLRGISIESCDIHGETKHAGSHCLRCLAAERYELKRCQIHGLSKFTRSGCVSCRVGASVTLGNCELHGETKFRSGRCSRCSFEESVSVKRCELHGEVRFRGESCLSCRSVASNHLATCSVHGETLHGKVGCLRCRAQELYITGNCEIHGATAHRSGSCLSCIAEGRFSEAHCEIHGSTLFSGNSCCKCTADSSVRMGRCEIHGETKFSGDRCRRCINDGALGLKECSTHGLVQHMGDSCLSCSSQKIFSKGSCEIHGEVKLRKGRCARCVAAAAWSERDCPIHGLSKFNGENCTKCLSAAQRRTAICEVHGETEFKGKSCCRCTAEKTAHSRFHRDRVDSSCRLCSTEEG